MNKISGEEGRGKGGDRGGDLIDCSAIPLSSSSTLLCCFGNVAFFAQAQPVCSSVTLRFARRKEASSSSKSATSDDANGNFANCRGLKLTYFFAARQARRIETTKGVLMIARAVIIQSEFCAYFRESKTIAKFRGICTSDSARLFLVWRNATIIAGGGPHTPPPPPV